MITGATMARRRRYATEAFPGFRTVLSRLVGASPGLLLVGVIFGGIRAGVFTAVETVRTTGLIVFVIGAAASFGWLLAYLQVPAAAVQVLTSITHDKYLLLLLMILILLVLGTFMDLAPLIIVCTPIFLPVAKAIGIDPVHFGVILILKGGLGLITPPIGSVLFVGAAIGRISIVDVLRTIWPFYLAILGVLLVVAYVPALSLWLPGVLRAAG
jgi:tripartite ATP-independent transporter DctM subunit